MSGLLKKAKVAISLAALAIVIPSVVSANRIDLSSGQPVLIICEDEIQLNSHDGSLSISGELIAYENAIYRMRTALGDVLIDAATVECEGAGCPSSADVLAGILAAEKADVSTN